MYLRCFDDSVEEHMKAGEYNSQQLSRQIYQV